MGGAGITVKLGRLRHTQTFASAQRGDIFIRESLNLPSLLSGIGGRWHVSRKRRNGKSAECKNRDGGWRLHGFYLFGHRCEDTAMSADIDHGGKARTPPGVRRVEDTQRGVLHIPDIKVRCRRQAADEPPMFARSRFAWNMGEVSGSLGDLGTFLPHIVGAITIVGMDPTGILMTFGLFYALSGAFYGVPMAVQPMKAASAAVLIEPMDPSAIAGAGLVIGAFFLVLGMTGVVSRLARVLPGSIASGLQLGLGLSLAGLGLRLIETQILARSRHLGIDARDDALQAITGRAHCRVRGSWRRTNSWHRATVSDARFRAASTAFDNC